MDAEVAELNVKYDHQQVRTRKKAAATFLKNSSKQLPNTESVQILPLKSRSAARNCLPSHPIVSVWHVKPLFSEREFSAASKNTTALGSLARYYAVQV